MKKDITYVALDDSKNSIVAGLLRPQAAEPELRQFPNEPKQLRRFFTRLQREGPVSSCYEAGPAGYELYRQLTALGVPCQVMAPALTPRKPGDRIKTNRRDAAKLVRAFRAGDLTPIRVPDEAQEAIRDLLRCREDVKEDLLRWRHRLLKFLARHGRVYREGRHWTQRHWAWLRGQRFADPVLGRTCQEYRFTVEQLLTRRADLEREIATIAQQAPYRTPVGWLRCFRGIDTLSALALLIEVGDFQRFPHPRQLMAYIGLVPSEASTGDRERRGSITKAGNTHVRRVLVESAWHYRHPPRLGTALARRSQGQPPAVLAQAWHAQRRLHRRVPPPRRAREAAARRGGGHRPRTRRVPVGGPDPDRGARPGGIAAGPRGAMRAYPEATEARRTMQARLESPRRFYATRGLRPGGLAPLDGGSSRRSTVMRPPVSTGVTRAYQSDSSSKPPHRRPAPGPQDPLDARPRPLEHAAPHLRARRVLQRAVQELRGGSELKDTP